MIAVLQDIVGPENKGKYNSYTITYTKDGENRKTNIVSFGDSAPAFKQLESGEFGPGSTVNLEMKKKDKYWNVVNISQASEGDVKAAPASKPVAKSGWQPDPSRETPEERYLKNLAICRQNALTNAVNTVGGDADVDQILFVADRFFGYTTQDFISGDTVIKKVEQTFK